MCLLRVVFGGDRSRGRPVGSLFNCYYTKLLRRVQVLYQDCSTLPSILTLYCWMLSKEVSRNIFKVFGITWPGIEPRSPRSWTNTPRTKLMSRPLLTNTIRKFFDNLIVKLSSLSVTYQHTHTHTHTHTQRTHTLLSDKIEIYTL